MTAPLEIQYRSPGELLPYERNARRHSRKQLAQIAASIQRFGFTNPVLIDDEGRILAGHGRVEAAKAIGLEKIPTVRLSQMSEADRRAYIIVDNKIALNAGWDQEILAGELQALIDLGFEVELTGFSLAEVDLTIVQAEQSSADGQDKPEDDIPLLGGTAITRQGDHWRLGRHSLFCADARDQDAFQRLMGGDRAQLIFTDPPYNVPIDGHVCGLGEIRHREFAMAAGEMTSEQFTRFLETTLGHGAAHCSDGAIAYVCMDWRHIRELTEAGRTVFSELKNLCVWNKTNAGMGTFYRSKHELIFVYKIGDAPHVNNFGLGDTGRYRTNVWDYPGVNGWRADRMGDLAMHPTTKPVALVKDAIMDCSRRGAIVLDMFGGSGTTLIAAEKTGRIARLIEFDPLYCDSIIRRYEQLSGRPAIYVSTGDHFELVAQQRQSSSN